MRTISTGDLVGPQHVDHSGWGGGARLCSDPPTAIPVAVIAPLKSMGNRDLCNQFQVHAMIDK